MGFGSSSVDLKKTRPLKGGFFNGRCLVTGQEVDEASPPSMAPLPPWMFALVVATEPLPTASDVSP